MIGELVFGGLKVVAGVLLLIAVIAWLYTPRAR